LKSLPGVWWVIPHMIRQHEYSSSAKGDVAPACEDGMEKILTRDSEMSCRRSPTLWETPYGGSVRCRHSTHFLFASWYVPRCEEMGSAVGGGFRQSSIRRSRHPWISPRYNPITNRRLITRNLWKGMGPEPVATCSLRTAAT
jgi:hypothetical protein